MSQPSPAPTTAPKTIPKELFDKSKYIRTYAMDYARVSAQASQNPPIQTHQDKKGFFDSLKTSLHSDAPIQTVRSTRQHHVDESLITHEDEVQAQQARELSDIEREAEERDRQAAAAQKEISDELSGLNISSAPIELPKIVPQAQPTRPIVASQAATPITQASKTGPADLPAKQVSPEAATRESILDRLRQKTQSQQATLKDKSIQPITVQKIEKNSTESKPLILPGQAPMSISAPIHVPAPEKHVVPPPTPKVESLPPVPEPIPLPAPAPTPKNVARPTVITSPEISRDELLARLHARTQEKKPAQQPASPRSKAESKPLILPGQAPVPKSDASQELPQIAWHPPVPEMPHPSAIPEVVPQTETIVQPSTPVTPVQAPQPTSFHSFSTDFAQKVDTEKASAFSVLAAEKDAAPAPQPKRKTSLLPIMAGIVLILGGGIGVLYAYQFVKKSAPTQVASTVPTLITPDSTDMLTGSNLSLALSEESNKPIGDGQVVLTYVNVSTTTSTGTVQTPQYGDYLFAHLNTNAPNILIRNIEAPSAVGVVHAGAQTRPYFLFKVNSYSRTFLGMLDWESKMASDLNMFYPAYGNDASSTVKTQFVDDIVASHNVRVLRDQQGRSLIMYGYTADQQVLIIARGEQAFSLLLSRITTSGN